MQPVSRLPPEILSHIIWYIPEEDARDASSIIRVTHVCRYWRNSIVSTPENWSRISNQPIGLAKLSLERCKAAPLELWLDISWFGVTPEFSDLIAPYIHNTKVLGVRCGLAQEQLARTVQNILPSMHDLRSLSLFGHSQGSGLWDWLTDPFGQLTSSLTHLSLSDTPLCPSFMRPKFLTVFELDHSQFNLHLDVLLDFLEQNRSLERAVLSMQFASPSLRSSRRRMPMKNRLRDLWISSDCAVDIDALISKVAVQEGAHLTVGLFGDAESKDICSIVSTTHLLNLRSPTFMEYYSDRGADLRTIRLLGKNGSFSLNRYPEAEALFVEFPLLPLGDIRTFHLKHRLSIFDLSDPVPTVFPPLFLPALETFAIEHETALSYLLSALFSNPFSSPSLKTFAFLDCRIDQKFMKELTRFASNRGKSTSARLHRVVIVNSAGQLPPFTLIGELGKYVPVVDVHVGKDLPSDLKWNGVVY